MSELQLPAPRAKNIQIQQNVFNWLNTSSVPVPLISSIISSFELFSNIVNKLSGNFSNPEKYLNSLVDFSKSLNQAQKVAVITGANTGIGFVTADYLYRAGYYVILACRNEQKAQDAIKKIQSYEGDGQLKFIKFDGNSLNSIQQFAQEFEKLNLKLDLLVNNAGIMMPPSYEQTEDFVESQIGVNFLSHYYLTDLLIPHLNNSSKIINLSSIAGFCTKGFNLDTITNKDLYNPIENYAQSKLVMAMFTYYLHEKLQSRNITVYSVHPGMVDTDLFNLNPFMKIVNIALTLVLKNPLVGAFTTLRCALLPPSKDHGEYSLYYADENPFIPPNSVNNRQYLEELVSWAKEAIKSKGFELRSSL